MQQSLKAIKPEGVISIIGFLGGMAKEQPTFLDCLMNICTVRGVLVGSRLQFESMNECIDANGIKPVVDEKVFQLEELREAYQYMVLIFSSLSHFRMEWNLGYMLTAWTVGTEAFRKAGGYDRFARVI